jgi:hypothetical protein
VVLMISKSGELRPVLKAVAPKDQAAGEASSSGISIEEAPTILPPPIPAPIVAPAAP